MKTTTPPAGDGLITNGDEIDEICRGGALVTFILSGAVLFAGLGLASVEINRSIGVVSSVISFFIGSVQARCMSSTCLMSFILSAASLVVAFTNLQ